MGNIPPRTHAFRTGPLPQGLRLAIVGEEGGFGGFHIGIVFEDNGELKHLHLAWHHRVRLESVVRIQDNGEGLFWVELALEDLEEEYILSRLRRISDRRKGSRTIPYGLSYEDGYIAEDGSFQSQRDCGLTCATFVLAVFKSSQQPLIEGPWPRRQEDEGYQRGLLAEMRLRHGHEEEHCKKFEQEVGCPRFRPEEVAAAGTAAHYPADFDYCEPVGRVFLREFLPMVREAF